MISQLQADHVTLVVVDFQERLMKIMDEAVTARSTTALSLFLQMFNRWNLPVVVTQQYTKGLGETYEPVRRHFSAHQTIIEKMTFSCCGVTPFTDALNAAGRKQVILTGMETHICVLQTALDLLERGYQVYIPVDAVQSSNKMRYRNGLHMMEKAGAFLTNSESLLFQMLGRCDSDDFKFFQKLLKEANQA